MKVKVLVADSGMSPIYAITDLDSDLTAGANQRVVEVDDPAVPSIYCHWDGYQVIPKPFPGSVYDEELKKYNLFESKKYDIVPDITLLKANMKLLNKIAKKKFAEEMRDKVDLITGNNKWEKLRNFLKELLEDEEIGEI